MVIIVIITIKMYNLALRFIHSSKPTIHYMRSTLNHLLPGNQIHYISWINRKMMYYNIIPIPFPLQQADPPDWNELRPYYEGLVTGYLPKFLKF